MKILVTGFDPFDGDPINPSWEAVRRLPDTVERAEIIKVMIPTSFGRSADVVRAAILEHDPDVVVIVGQAGGQFAISPERIAINVDDGRIPDNDRNRPIDTPIRSDGPAAYFSFAPRQSDSHVTGAAARRCLSCCRVLTLLSSRAARGQLDLRHAQDSYDRGNSRRKLRWIGDGRLWWPLDQYGRGRVGRLD
jgi:hypothetical protein